MRGEFDRELKELHKNLLKMGTYIEKSIDDAIKAFEKQDISLYISCKRGNCKR